MSSKTDWIAALRDELTHWDRILAGLSEAECTAPLLSDGQSIKDTLAHLMSWQEVSRARVAAALHDGEPQMPAWLHSGDPESEDDLNTYNARIAVLYRERSWVEVHQLWRDGFVHLLALVEAVPDALFDDAERFPWLNGYPLSAVLQGTYEHHRTEHREPIAEQTPPSRPAAGSGRGNRPTA